MADTSMQCQLLVRDRAIIIRHERVSRRTTQQAHLLLAAAHVIQESLEIFHRDRLPALA